MQNGGQTPLRQTPLGQTPPPTAPAAAVQVRLTSTYKVPGPCHNCHGKLNLKMHRLQHMGATSQAAAELRGVLAAKNSEAEATLLRRQLAQLTADFQFNLKLLEVSCWILRLVHLP